MFHWRDGWFFERVANSSSVPDPNYASVRIIKRKEPKDDSPVVVEALIPPSEWASIVASVSALGETGASFRMFEAAQKG